MPGTDFRLVIVTEELGRMGRTPIYHWYYLGQIPNVIVFAYSHLLKQAVARYQLTYSFIGGFTSYVSRFSARTLVSIG